MKLIFWKIEIDLKKKNRNFNDIDNLFVHALIDFTWKWKLGLKKKFHSLFSSVYKYPVQKKEKFKIRTILSWGGIVFVSNIVNDSFVDRDPQVENRWNER